MTVFTSEQKSLSEAITTLSQAVRPRTTDAGAAGTLTTAEVINGVYHQLDGGTPGTATLPTAAQLVAAIKGCTVGTSFRFLVHNADGADTLTVAQGSGGTPFGTLTVAAGKNREFLVVITNVTASSEAYVLYGLAALA